MTIVKPRRRRGPRLVALCVLGTLGATAGRAEPPSIDYVSPAGLQRGTTVTIAIGGKFPTWPYDAWVSRPGLRIAPIGSGSRGKIVATADAEAAPGAYWFRLFDANGATNLQPIIVGVLPEVSEIELNNEIRRAHRLSQSAVVVNGVLQLAGDVDAFAAPIAPEGRTLVAALDANQTVGSPVDAVLQVVGASGLTLAQNHDAHGLDPRIAMPAPAGRPTFVRVFGFPAQPNATIGFAGGAGYAYRLTISTGPVADHAWPLAVARSEVVEAAIVGWNVPVGTRARAPAPEGVDEVWLHDPTVAGVVALRIVDHPALVESESPDPIAIPTPVTISGRLDAPKDRDVFTFAGKTNVKYRCRAESRELGFPMDPVLSIQDSAGKALVELDDVGGNADAEIQFVAPADGTYSIQIRDLHEGGGERYVYRLTVEPATPDYRLSLTAETFVVTPQAPAEVVVTVNRREGFAEPIEIAAESLPAGVVAAPVVSAPTGDSAKSVKLSLTTGGTPANGPFEIVGRSKGPTQRSVRASFDMPRFHASSDQPWVTSTSPPPPAKPK